MVLAGTYTVKFSNAVSGRNEPGENNSIIFDMIFVFVHEKTTLFNPFQRSVAFHIETSHLFSKFPYEMKHWAAIGYDE